MSCCAMQCTHKGDDERVCSDKIDATRHKLTMQFQGGLTDGMMSALINAASSDTKNAIACAMSAGAPTRPTGY